MIDTLKQSTLFSDFTNEELIKITPLLSKREFHHGDYLMREGDDGKSLFILESGSVDILKQSINGSASYISEVMKGSIIGEAAFFDKHKRMANVVAKGHVVVWELNFTSLEKLIFDDPKLGIHLHNAIAISLIEKLNSATVGLSEFVASSRLVALGDLVTSIAHEINNPLATIRLLIGQITDAASSGSVEREAILNMSSTMDKTFHHIAKIMEGIKLASRSAQNDRMEFAPVKELVENTFQLCRGKFRTSSIQVEISVVPENLKIQCRPTQISQVILNLISNSYDAVEQLSDRWIKIEASESRECFQISVTDSGGGIPIELEEKIFAPFFSTKGLGKGTGIGLSISKRIIESYQGKFFVDHDSANTRFVIQLPKLESIKGG